MYTANFRVGGTSGEMKLLFGGFAEAGESVIPMYVFVCLKCGKIELYGTEDLRQKAVNLANKSRL